MAESENVTTVPPRSGKIDQIMWSIGDDVFPFYLTRKRLEEIATFQPRPSDIFIATYPKSGTTWVQSIVQVLKTHNQISQQLDWIQPYLEFPLVGSSEEGDKLPVAPFYYTYSFMESLENPRVFKTHLRFQRIPYSPDCKYIYTYRNPKDVAVSDYYYSKGLKFISYVGSFDHYLEQFMSAGRTHGLWYDHVLSWWRVRDKPNILVLSYESLILNFKDTIIKIADFLGLEYSEEIFNLVHKYTKFDSMKVNACVNKSIIPWNPDCAPFMRKGTIGDWKDHFTQEQNDKFEKWYSTPLADSGLLEHLIFQLP